MAKNILLEESMFKNNENLLNDKSIEAIFELNLGDFLTEHLISEDFAEKISTSSKNKVEKIKNQLKELISIYSLDNTLNLLGFSSSEDFIIYNSIAKTVVQMLDIDACHIFLTKENIKTDSPFDLTLIGSSSPDISIEKIGNIGLNFADDENIIVKSFTDKKTVYAKEFSKKDIFDKQEVKTALAVPMASNAGETGVIYLESYTKKDILSEYIQLIEITAKIFVTSMKLQALIEETMFLLDDDFVTVSELTNQRTELTAIIGDISDEQQIFVEALAEAADAKGQYKKEHYKNVANTAKEISSYLKLNEKTVDLIYYAGMLQNVGKISLPEEILFKKNLSKEDWDKLQNQTNIGVDILMNINFLSEVIPYIHYHRERWDGKGQPEGLSGHSIPLGSRIIAVADAFQAMITKRPYREPISVEKALDILKSEAGIKWDPIVVDALVGVMHDKQ